MEYATWSRAWKDARHDSTPIDRVLDLWRVRPPLDCRRESWPERGRAFRPLDKGYRKTGKRDQPAGEQVIEKALLGDRGSEREHRLRRGSQALTLKTYLHNMALSNVRTEQVVADAFGILKVHRRFHPISIEVKVTDGGWWSAVVQCLQQVRMLRCNLPRLTSFCANHLDAPHAKGSWGMVLAPGSYFQKSAATRAKTCTLLDR